MLKISTADEIIEWAKKTGFKFKQNNFGNNKVGCAITAIARMNDISVNNADEIDIFFKQLVQQIEPINVFRISRGFDSPQFNFEEGYRKLGRDVYLKAKENNLLVV